MRALPPGYTNSPGPALVEVQLQEIDGLRPADGSRHPRAISRQVLSDEKATRD